MSADTATDMPEPEIDPPAGWRGRGLSVVWVVPLLALTIALAVAWRSYSERGVPIVITFEDGAGVTAGETTLRYRDVVIGVAEEVGFTNDLSRVVVSARIHQNVAPFLDESARFWVVRPEVSTQGVSGLSTVLSGVYIQGDWDSEAGTAQTRFEGLETRPLTDQSEEGTRIVLRTADGDILSAGTPIFFRGVQVGRLETPELDAAGTAVTVEAFIEAPHDRFLTTATRFWDKSGFELSFGAGGLKFEVGSIAALLGGGVAFNTFFSGGQPVEEGHVYNLYADEAAARENAFSPMSMNTVRLDAFFEGGVAGLAIGAAVRYQGVEIGRVETISAFVTGEGDTMVVRQRVGMTLDPELMGLSPRAGLSEVLNLLAVGVANGLRARLEKANLLTSSLIVDFVEIEDAPEAEIDVDAEPHPLMPSVPTELTDLNATFEDVMKRVNNLRIEELIQQAMSLMGSVEDLVRSEELRAVPAEVAGLIGEARDLVGTEVAGLIGEAREIVGSDAARALPAEIAVLVDELRAIVEAVNAEGVVTRIATVLDDAARAVDGVAEAAEGLPALVEDLRALAAKARDLDAESLVDAAIGLVENADRFIASEGLRDLPPALRAALDQLRALLDELREGGAVTNVNSALASAKSAAESIERASADLPELSARLEALIARSEDLIGAYGANSQFNSETLAMLREVRDAARTVNSLARALERNPNSLLFGK